DITGACSSLQADGSPSHSHPSWIAHCAQPSLFDALPSSHSSPASSPPLPQSDVQSDGSPSHDQSVSTVQVALQPSFGVVLVSSHCSSPWIWPLPHTMAQAEGVPEQAQPGSTAQLGAQ